MVLIERRPLHHSGELLGSARVHGLIGRGIENCGDWTAASHQFGRGGHLDGNKFGIPGSEGYRCRIAFRDLENRGTESDINPRLRPDSFCNG
jgi:hypothetical protein